jgi:hypothetical protein
VVSAGSNPAVVQSLQSGDVMSRYCGNLNLPMEVRAALSD